jgi:NAD(P)H-hydrate epimerase
MTTSTLVPTLPARAAEAHKGDFGRVLVIAGSRGMSGAAVLCGSASLRGGAGLVQVAVPGEIQAIVAAGNPCYLTAACDQDLRGRFAASATEQLVDLASSSDVVAVGPGIGQSGTLPGVIAALIGRIDKPLIIDADGLNAVAQLGNDALRNRRAPIVLTPHPGEFARLTRRSIAEFQTHRQDIAVAYAAEHSAILVLKGHCTLVTDGRQVYRNTTGNPGMASGGTGDVLTGLIAALIGQRLEPFAAAVLATWAHGRAGDLAAERIGQTALVATDLLDYLPSALREKGG